MRLNYKFKRTVNENHVNGERSVFIFEFKDLEVIEISCTFASRNKNVTNMPRSTRKKSKTGIYHVMLRVNTEPSLFTMPATSIHVKGYKIPWR